MYMAKHRDQILLDKLRLCSGPKGMLHSIAKAGKCNDSPQCQLLRLSSPRRKSLLMALNDAETHSQVTANGIRKATCKSISIARKIDLSTRLSIRSLVSFRGWKGALCAPSKLIPGRDVRLGAGSVPTAASLQSPALRHLLGTGLREGSLAALAVLASIPARRPAMGPCSTRGGGVQPELSSGCKSKEKEILFNFQNVSLSWK